MKKFLLINLAIIIGAYVHAQVNFSSTLLAQDFESSTDYTQYFNPNLPPAGDSLGTLRFINGTTATAAINTNNTNYLLLTRPTGGATAATSPVFVITKSLTSEAANISKFVFDLAFTPSAGAAVNANAAHIALGNGLSTTLGNPAPDTRYIVRTVIAYDVGAPGTTPFFYLRQPPYPGTGTPVTPDFRSVNFTSRTRFVIISNNTAGAFTYYIPDANGNNTENTATLNAYSYCIYTGGNIVRASSATASFDNIPNWGGGPANGTPIDGLKISAIPSVNVPQFTMALDNIKITYNDTVPPVAPIIPVIFGDVNSVFKTTILTVTWTTEHERISDHFNIWASRDSTTGWKKVGTVASLAPNGNSSGNLLYKFNISSLGLQLAGITLLYFIPLLVIGRRHRLLMAVILVIGIASFALSCKKSDVSNHKPFTGKLFVKIEHVSKNGDIEFTEVKEAVVE